MTTFALWFLLAIQPAAPPEASLSPVPCPLSPLGATCPAGMFFQSMTVNGGTVLNGGGLYSGVTYPKSLAASCSTRTRAVWTAAGVPASQDFLEVSAAAAVEGGFCRPDTLPESETFTRPSS